MTLLENVKCHQNLNAIENPPFTVKPSITYHRGKRRTQNEVHNGCFPIDAQIRFELVAEEIKFLVHCFVDIVLI